MTTPNKLTIRLDADVSTVYPVGMTAKLVFLHGLESGPHGSKYQALRDLDPDLVAPDCTRLNDIESRLAVIEKDLAGLDKVVLVGSSYGGLAALMYVQRGHNMDRVAGCLLCAPALTKAVAESFTQIPRNTIVLHGTLDEVIPYRTSEEFCSARGIRLVTVEDDHRLSKSRDLMVALAKELMQKTSCGDT